MDNVNEKLVKVLRKTYETLPNDKSVYLSNYELFIGALNDNLSNDIELKKIVKILKTILEKSNFLVTFYSYDYSYAINEYLEYYEYFQDTIDVKIYEEIGKSIGLIFNDEEIILNDEHTLIDNDSDEEYDDEEYEDEDYDDEEYEDEDYDEEEYDDEEYEDEDYEDEEKEVEDINNIYINSKSGDITIEIADDYYFNQDYKINGDSLTVTTFSDDIDITLPNIQFSNIVVNSLSGDIDIKNVNSERFSINSYSGNITLKIKTYDHDINVINNTISGDIICKFDGYKNLSIVNPGRNKSIYEQMGNGKIVNKNTTLSGEIIVRK